MRISDWSSDVCSSDLGPQRIATFGGGDEPLQPGMILSNEPGYYKTGEYGIRIAKLVLGEKRELSGAEREMMGFETLTFATIDRKSVESGKSVCVSVDLGGRRVCIEKISNLEIGTRTPPTS